MEVFREGNQHAQHVDYIWGLFWENSQRVEAVSCFRGRAPSCIFDRILKVTLPNNLIIARRRSEEKLSTTGVTQRNLGLLILLIYTKNSTMKFRSRFVQLHQEHKEGLVYKANTLTNSRAVAHKSWMARCSPHTPGFYPNHLTGFYMIQWYKFFVKSISKQTLITFDTHFHALTFSLRKTHICAFHDCFSFKHFWPFI